MKAIYKRELKSYFTSVIGCLFISATVLISGVFFIIRNMLNQEPSVYGVILMTALGLTVLIPILTMKTLSDERRLKTDQLILTSSVSLIKIVLGKFFALVTIYIIPILIMCLYPISLKKFGEINLVESYSMIGGLFLYGVALIAIGMFISALTETQVIAAVISALLMLLGFFMGNITSAISQDGNVITKILNVFYLYGPLENIVSGQITLAGLVYYLSIIVLFIFLTCQAIQKRRWSVSKNTVGTSVFSYVTIAIVLVIVVFANLCASMLTDKVQACSIDVSQNKLYTLSAKTEKMAKNLKKDIDIYVLAPKNNSDELINKTLANYKKCSDHINVEYINTDKEPNFHKNYGVTDKPNANSLIVECKSTKKYRFIDINDIYIQEQNQMMAMYGQQQETPVYYDAEGQIDNAISLVQSDKKFSVYQVKGHSEIANDSNSFGTIDNLKEVITKHHGELKEVNLATQKSVTTDNCDLMLILGPVKDFSKADAKKLDNYLKLGGKVIVALESQSPSKYKKPNLYGVLKKYNVKVTDGIVFEGDSNSYDQMYGPTFMLEQGKEGFASEIKDEICFPVSLALSKADSKNEDASYTAMVSTSDSAFQKPLQKKIKKYTKEKGDKSGPFDVAVSVDKNVAATEKSSVGTDKADTKQANLVVLASVYMLSDEIDSAYGNTSTQLVSNALDQYLDSGVETVVVAKKQVSVSRLVTKPKHTIIYGAILFVIFAVILAYGIVVWAVRRKK